MNRIATAITAQEKNIAKRLADGRTNQDDLNKLDHVLDMELFEYVRFQEIKSVAVSAQILTLDEANTVYAYLGNTPETFNKEDLAVKVVLTELFRMLMEAGV